MVVPVTMSVMSRWCKECLLAVVPDHVRDEAVLDVAAQDALLGEGNRVLLRIVAPPVHPSEEKRTVRLLCHVLVQVVLEELLLPVLHFSFGLS